MDFKLKEHYKRNTKLSAPDGEVGGGIIVLLSHWHDDQNVASIFKIHCGPCAIQVRITPEQARELAENLLTHANEVAEHIEQFEYSSKLEATCVQLN